jgi:hypothetical protein
LGVTLFHVVSGYAACSPSDEQRVLEVQEELGEVPDASGVSNLVDIPKPRERIEDLTRGGDCGDATRLRRGTWRTVGDNGAVTGRIGGHLHLRRSADVILIHRDGIWEEIYVLTMTEGWTEVGGVGEVGLLF